MAANNSSIKAARLTPKQEKYVQGLFLGMKQIDAYKDAYDAENMKDKTLYEKACLLAGQDNIQARLFELNKKVEAKVIITKEWVLDNLKTIAERCMQAEPITVNGMPTGEFKFDSSGANKSLELLGKHLKLFTDRIESENTNINIDADMDLFHRKATADEKSRAHKMSWDEINAIMTR